MTPISRSEEWAHIKRCLENLRAFEHDRTLVEQMNEKLAGTRYERSGGPMFGLVEKIVKPGRTK